MNQSVSRALHWVGLAASGALSVVSLGLLAVMGLALTEHGASPWALLLGIAALVPPAYVLGFGAALQGRVSLGPGGGWQASALLGVGGVMLAAATLYLWPFVTAPAGSARGADAWLPLLILTLGATGFAALLAIRLRPVGAGSAHQGGA